MSDVVDIFTKAVILLVDGLVNLSLSELIACALSIMLAQNKLIYGFMLPSIV